MSKTTDRKPKLTFHPLTLDRWDDFETLFGRNGACGGCWCMWWRLTRSEFQARQGEANHRAMKKLVRSGTTPGILAYSGDTPVGWCSVGPRESFGVIERSPVLKRMDDLPAWSIVCLYVAKDHRRQGVADRLVAAAVDFARLAGAKVVESYPTVPRGKDLPPVSNFRGVPSMYIKAGFEEAARPSQSRMIMRRYLRGK